MKIGYIIAAYFGNRDYVHGNYIIDKLYYIKTQLQYINISNINIHKIYIVCTFQDNSYKDVIISELTKLLELDSRICVIERDNLGGSYCSWHTALKLDNGDSDYIVLIEDDYSLSSEDSIELMVEYFKKYPNLFYLCQYWTSKPYHLVYESIDEIIPHHAAISCGLLNNKMYNQSLNDGLDFKLIYKPGKETMFANQVLFLENYRKADYKIMDYTEEYSSIFTQGIIEYGNPNGKKIILPIIEKFFN